MIPPTLTGTKVAVHVALTSSKYFIHEGVCMRVILQIWEILCAPTRAEFLELMRKSM